jgi:hypothetical protein
MRAALPVWLCLLLLAGCNTTAPGAPATPTVEATPAPVPQAVSYPPGVDESDVANPVDLATAHGRAAGDRYVVVSNYTVRYANGTVHSTVAQHSRVSPEGWRATLAVGGRRPGVVSSTPATAVFWSNGTVLVERIRRGDETKYLYIPAAEYNGGNGFYNSLRRPVPYREPWALLESLDTRVVATRNGSVVVAADGLTRPGLFASVVAVDAPRNVSYRATVTPAGLLRDQQLSYAGELDDGSVRVTRTIRYRPLDAPVTRPDWYQTARERSVRNRRANVDD